ncbi:NYN domain-containing protein [bacterium]|nr:NYN domain-containing protein [bacterium]
MDIIIDGYNLIFQCGLQTNSTADDMLEQSRNRLLSEIASFGGVEVAKRTTIVFDAAHRPLAAKTNRYRIKNVLVLYADRFDDADSMIEHLITRHSTPKKLTVVSSDHRLHKAALRRKAKPIDSEIWYDLLIEGKLMSKTAAVKLPRPDGLVDVDWHDELQIDAMDISAIQAEVEAESASEADPAREDTAIDGDVSNPFPPGYGEDLLGE